MLMLTSRPVLTLPRLEASHLVSEYGGARTILEYGSGGSTVMAAEMPGRVIYSVEGDLDWFSKMVEWFRRNPAKSDVFLHHVDIGPTKNLSYPIDNNAVTKWSDYPVSVWDRKDFRHPDVVLIDGRFRLACALTTLFRIARPTVMLIDDYIDREGYKRIETLVGPPEMIGRMARFQINPQTMPSQHLSWIAAAFSITS